MNTSHLYLKTVSDVGGWVGLIVIHHTPVMVAGRRLIQGTRIERQAQEV